MTQHESRPPGPRLLVLFNPKAGLQRVSRELLEERLREAGADYELVVLRGDRDLSRLIAARDPAGERVVVAAGGDGTACSAAAAVVGTGRSFGVLPLGTRNHFARDSGVPLDLREAIANLQCGVPTPVDTGEVNGHLFINNASLGLYPRFVQARRRLGKRTARWLAIVGSAWWVVRRRRHLDLRIDDGAQELRASVVFIGNNRYALEGLELGQRERLDEGVMTLAVARLTGPVSAARMVARAVIGSLEQERDYTAQIVRAVKIGVRRRRVRVALDGETLRLQPPLHFQLRARSLQLLLPRPADAPPPAAQLEG